MLTLKCDKKGCPATVEIERFEDGVPELWFSWFSTPPGTLCPSCKAKYNLFAESLDEERQQKLEAWFKEIK